MNQFSVFALQRIIAGILVAGLVLWGVTILIKYLGPGATPQVAHYSQTDEKPIDADRHSPGKGSPGDEHGGMPPTVMKDTGMDALDTTPDTNVAHGFRTEEKQEMAHEEGNAKEGAHSESEPASTDSHTAPLHTPPPAVPPAVEEKTHGGVADSHTPPVAPSTSEDKTHGVAADSHSAHGTPVRKNLPKGVAFVEATIKPLTYELTERFWGWRPNDIIRFTDNVNNYQRGVLEVTRKTSFALAERISRTGSTEAFNTHLERAMNWLMVKADNYWFPSPETKYREVLKELEIYKEQLESGQASFYTRTDNIIPLLQAFENLLGSCEENLVKTHEKDGEKVSYFKADDYFFYAQGVASAMGNILEAVLADFGDTIDTRRGIEVLHHAIESCHHATEIDPWIILNSKSDSVFANHRANMAAPISHARFFVGVLIKAIST